MSRAIIPLVAAAADCSNPHKLCAANAHESKQVCLRRRPTFVRRSKTSPRDGDRTIVGRCRAAGSGIVEDSKCRCFGSCWALFDHNRQLSSFSIDRIDRKLAVRAEKSGRKNSAEPGELNKASEMADMWERVSTSTKIFFMAFFWVFLFFGASAWDGKSTGGKSRRGPRK
ncbi:hypothetical protein O6H91_01G026200 [Diphasiastrum complanatum]|uniref:Uncharacterized protein n=1 Tax=Diphasiastrum complanatum TaxID=34168 RepID=A0ACC2EPB8_DIPCM|nr:hypothetical protein O6H91_01G026200 [Diphasiastrum complanatum]